MNSKWKKSTICLVTLVAVFSTSAPLRASGIPVVDGALVGITQSQNFQTIIQWGKEAMHWAKEITHYSAVIQNWKDNFKNMLRSKISEFFGIQLSGKMSESELTRIWEKGRARCNQISNEISKSYCNQMITLEIEKIKLYFEGENSIDTQWNQFLRKREEYNRAQGNNANNANQLKSISEDMEKILNKIEIDMGLYKQRIELLDTRIDWMRQARVKIAQEQLQGTNRTIVDNVAKAAVIGTLTVSTERSRNKAEDLRQASKRRSEEAFQQNM